MDQLEHQAEQRYALVRHIAEVPADVVQVPPGLAQIVPVELAALVRLHFLQVGLEGARVADHQVAAC